MAWLDPGRVVLPGDEICNVTLYCWVVEDEAKFRERCKATTTEMKAPDEGNTGGFACKETRPSGEFDIDSYKFFDTDTKCIIGVRGGPSMSDNDKIAACTRVARESIGPDHIKADAAPRRRRTEVRPRRRDTDVRPRATRGARSRRRHGAGSRRRRAGPGPLRALV